jgi:hypothetical protein
MIGDQEGVCHKLLVTKSRGTFQPGVLAAEEVLPLSCRDPAMREKKHPFVA